MNDAGQDKPDRPDEQDGPGSSGPGEQPAQPSHDDTRPDGPAEPAGEAEQQPTVPGAGANGEQEPADAPEPSDESDQAEESDEDHPEGEDDSGDYDEDYYDEEDYDYGEYDEDGYDEHEDWQEDQEEGEYEYEDEQEEEEEEEEDELGQKKMTLVEHLEELRTRLIRALLGLVVGVGAALALAPQIIAILSEPFKRIAGENGSLITVDMVDPFMMYLKMSLYIGIIASSPWIFYQIWMFIAAGLYPHERRYVVYAVPFSAGLFIAGSLFFLFVISQYILTFFFYFSKTFLGITPMITLKNHLTFMTNMMLVFGLCFQTPVAVLLLAKMGLVTTKTLGRFRKHVIVVILIIAAFCTSPSPLDQVALAIPMWLLYELGVVLAYFLVERKRRAEQEAEEAEG